MEENMAVAKPFLAAAGLAALIGIPAIANADPGDSAFLSSLDQLGIQYPNPTDAITSAKEVCDYLAQGHTSNQAARGVKNANPDLSLTKASQFVAMARATYCNQPQTAGES
ncbi:DUF732 domain-containing protein [Mycobacterium sp. SM1]|uniref:DUF732 domain-containing protein n=1 Tax=Mycobacterium sp. SM1 TaxID=2816243 RepID=UPI001BCF9DB3|nr:DUF732 domain-containing protein [Mycobacterium sp. SM1]MBS4730215.1 DUF732 domain-containing protein [Mycobacterium sp. SM1]